MADLVDTVAQAMWAAYPGFGTRPLPEHLRQRYRWMAQAMIDELGLTEEHQWTPVESSGHRWQPRTEELAIEHETRLVSPWVRAGGDDA